MTEDIPDSSDRAAVDKIFFEPVKRVTGDRQPVLYSMAGIPGAGKTTLAHRFLENGIFPRSALWHAPDDVMQSIPGYARDLEKLGKKEAFEIWEIPARRLTNELLERAIALPADIVYERGGATPDTIDAFKKMKKRGYRIEMHWVHLDPETALVRSRERDIHTPEEMIYKRNKILKELWPQYLTLADQIKVYDNSGEFGDYPAIAQAEKGNLDTLGDAEIPDFIAHPSL